jgi:Uncharacterized protein conserved in bacteria (DUF2325)
MLLSPVGGSTPPQAARRRQRRRTLWQLDGTLQCSIIGTCLSDADLLAAIRRSGLRIAPNVASHDLHTQCVTAAHRDCPLARSLNKTLERRFAGAVRMMGRAETPDTMQAVWQQLRDSGQVAAGYWAVMSHTEVPASLRACVFGEVHMLSHLNGQGANQLAMRLAQAEGKCRELEARLRRSEQARLEILAERDAVRARSAEWRPQPARRDGDEPLSIDRTTIDRASTIRRLEGRLGKCERALIAARVRARQAEATVARLTVHRGVGSQSERRGTNVVGGLPALARDEHALRQHRILYIGGRKSLLPHLRTAAEERVAEFFHHDGGLEDSLHRIEELIEGCDAVICPVDCVSHGACRMAKAICHRLNKRFLPIPTASRSGFERALEQLARMGGDERPVRDRRSVTP